MNEFDLKFLELESAVKTLKSCYQLFPNKAAQAVETIKNNLNWIELRCVPTGISEAILKQLRGVLISSTTIKGCSVVVKVQNVILKPGDILIVGTVISFNTSDSSDGKIGLTIEGTEKNPTEIYASQLSGITAYSLESPKNFLSWVNSHSITKKELSERVEKFALIDLGIVELNNLGLIEEDKHVMSDEKSEELKEEAKKKLPKTSTSSSSPTSVTAPSGSLSDTQVKKMHSPNPMYKPDAEMTVIKKTHIPCYDETSLEQYYD